MVDQPQRAADLLKKDTDRWRVSLFGDRLHIITDQDAGSGIRTTAQKLASEGMRVLSAREEPFSLEDAFISIVERARQRRQVAAEG
jgi:ABC-2 type transport system ATP-binding protein